jgi:hypothetical protein
LGIGGVPYFVCQVGVVAICIERWIPPHAHAKEAGLIDVGVKLGICQPRVFSLMRRPAAVSRAFFLISSTRRLA